MPNLSSDLSDPHPPVPGERERALVAARAHELGRRRRLVQGGGALALVAAVAVSVAALTAGGSSGAGGTNRVEAASSASDTTVSTPATHATTPTTAAPVPAPAPTEDTTPVATQEAPAATSEETAPVVPVAPSTFTLSGTVSGNPAGTTATVNLTGAGGQFTATADGAGNFSISGLPAGDYMAIGQWVDPTNSATNATKFGVVTINSDSSVSFSFSS
jgi:septal ring-binding cell division protein DamX